MIRWAVILLPLALAACVTDGTGIGGGCRISPGAKSSHCLPSGSLVGVEATVKVMTRHELDAYVKSKGYYPKGNLSVNEWTEWQGKKCTVYLSSDTEGMAALEHGLWHCKLGNWH